LLKHRKTDLAVIQCVAEIAAFVNPGRRNPRERQTRKLPDLVFTATWTRISKNRHVRLISNAELVQHRAPILPIIPDRDEVKSHPWIVIDCFGPAAAFQFSLTIRAPRRPQM